MTIREWQDQIGSLMGAKGFHDLPRSQTVPVQLWVEQRICRIHGEVTEVAEVVKKKFDTKAVSVGSAVTDGDADKLAEELADVIYRALDLGDLLDLDIERALVAKHRKNATRPVNYGTADEAKAG